MPYADINGIRYHYEISGSGDPVVLITGFGGSTHFWRRATELLSDRFTVISVDNRGAGLTEYNGEFSMDNMGDDVVALLKHLGYDSAHVLGWSMGSHIAQNIAIRHPSAVRNLVLVSTYRYRPSRTAYILTHAAEAVEKGAPPEFLGHMMNGMGYNEGYFKKKELDGTPVKTAVFNLQGLKDQFVAINGHDTGKTASLIKAPTLTIHGKDDIMVDYKEGDALSDLIPYCKRIRLDGVGHLVPSDFYIPQAADFFNERR